MSKGNLFLGMGRGKVGDLVFSRVGGQQVARSRNRSPKNPKSNLQILQRVVFATAGRAYSLLQPIADHSFEGLQTGTPNQSRFVAENAAKLRAKIAAAFQNPTDETITLLSVGNFNVKGDAYAVYNDYTISSGSLPSVVVTGVGEANARRIQLGSGISAQAASAPTYAEVAAALGMNVGEQLTVLGLVHDFDNDALYGSRTFAQRFEYARIILMPADGDPTKPFLSGSAINDANAKNEGSVTLEIADGHLRVVAINGVSIGTSGNAIVYAAAIASRLSNGSWLRSSQSFVQVVEDTSSLNINSDLIDAAWFSYLPQSQSGLYLNQASL